MKIKHYAKPLKIFANTEFENLVWQLVVIFVSGSLAFASYHTGFGILFFPFLIVCLLAIFGILIDIFFAITITSVNDKE